MITKKEDLINTYIENDLGELRKAYIDKAIELGYMHQWDIVRNYDWYNLPYIGIKRNWSLEFIGQTSDATRGIRDTKSKLLTLSDLKPRIKTEFVKVNYGMEHFAAGSDLFSGRDLHVLSRDGNYYKIKSQDKAVKASQDGRIYEKVETEIDERQEFIDECQKHGSWEAMYESGKFKLVEK
ncbi:putative coil containing protein [Vibrio phage 511E55-1]|nr:putative coil containing protein [Vibrio phage 511E55-1]